MGSGNAGVSLWPTWLLSFDLWSLLLKGKWNVLLSRKQTHGAFILNGYAQQNTSQILWNTTSFFVSKHWPGVSFHRVSILKAHAILLSYATSVMINSLGTITPEVVNSKFTLGRCLNFASEISKEKHIFKIRRASNCYFFLSVKFAWFIQSDWFQLKNRLLLFVISHQLYFFLWVSLHRSYITPFSKWSEIIGF